jgi:hypothetical protein
MKIGGLDSDRLSQSPVYNRYSVLRRNNNGRMVGITFNFTKGLWLYCNSCNVILIIQTILVLFGVGDHDMGADLSGHFDMPDGHFDASDASDGFALFSIRGIVAFFSVGGWAGIAFADTGAHPAVTILVSIAAGAAALIGIALLMQYANKLQSAGNISLKNAVGKTAKVYITVPGSKTNSGKVTLTFQGRFSECDAVTKAGRDLKTGELVKVVGLADENTLIVTPITADAAK